MRLASTCEVAPDTRNRGRDWSCHHLCAIARSLLFLEESSNYDNITSCRSSGAYALLFGSAESALHGREQCRQFPSDEDQRRTTTSAYGIDEVEAEQTGCGCGLCNCEFTKPGRQVRAQRLPQETQGFRNSVVLDYRRLGL